MIANGHAGLLYHAADAVVGASGAPVHFDKDQIIERVRRGLFELDQNAFNVVADGGTP